MEILNYKYFKTVLYYSTNVFSYFTLLVFTKFTKRSIKYLIKLNFFTII